LSIKTSIKIQKKEKKIGQIAARLALNNANNEGGV
jgi:hypothetical protein